VTIARDRTGPTLWQSIDSGHKLFGRSAFLRAFNVIMDRLKEASDSWPKS
jgi:hypothetical protein